MEHDVLQPQVGREKAQELPQQQPAQPVVAEMISVWEDALEKYRAGKANLDARIVAAEQWWKLRHWRYLHPDDGSPDPASGWLVNVILSKHSDAMDAYPETICLAREEGDRGEADMLGKIVPVIKQQNDFEKAWSDAWWQKLKSGTGCYGYFWDASKLNGLGDIAIRRVDPLTIFWEPGCADIQESKYLFSVALEDDGALTEQYPQLAGKLGGKGKEVARKYIYDDRIDTANKSYVVDVYYKKGHLLHMAKYCAGVLLYATENEPSTRERGLYDHGLYPFVLDPLFPEEGYPGCGYGYVDLCKDAQTVIDALNNALTEASVAAATPRWFVRTDGGFSEEVYADYRKHFIPVQGRLDNDTIRQVDPPVIPGYPMEFLAHKINELKEVSGNRDVNNGGTGASVTAASAIAALQEAGNGLSRDMISGSYRATRQGDYMIIELIRQFYDLPRKFRILGNDGGQQYITYTNAAIKPQPQGQYQGMDLGYRLPQFDIEVVAQSESSYTKQAYNELALQLYQLGFFDPANAERALLALDMMDFKGKAELAKKIQNQAMMFQMLQQYQQMAVALAGKYEPAMAQGLMAQIAGSQGGGAAGSVPGGQLAGPNAGDEEHWAVQRSREQAEEGAKPR